MPSPNATGSTAAGRFLRSLGPRSGNLNPLDRFLGVRRCFVPPRRPAVELAAGGTVGGVTNGYTIPVSGHVLRAAICKMR